MICNHCGSQIDDDAKFCTVCGKDPRGDANMKPSPANSTGPSSANSPAASPANSPAASPAKKRSPLPFVLGGAVLAAAAAAVAVFMLVVIPGQNRRKGCELADTFMKALDAGDYESAFQYMSEDLKKDRLDSFREIDESFQELIKPLDDAGLQESAPEEYKKICASAEDAKESVLSNIVKEYSLKESDVKADRTGAVVPVSVRIVSDVNFEDYLDDEMLEALMATYMSANMDKIMAYAFTEDDAAMEAEVLKAVYPPILKIMKTVFEEAPSSEEIMTIQTAKVGDEWKVTGLTTETVKEAEKMSEAEIREKKQKILEELEKELGVQSQEQASPSSPAAGSAGDAGGNKVGIDDYVGGWSGQSERWGLGIEKTGEDEVSISYTGSLGAESYEEMTAQGRWYSGHIVYSDAIRNVYEYDSGRDDFVVTESYTEYGSLTLRDRNFDPDSTEKSVLMPDGEEFYAASKYLVWEHEAEPVSQQAAPEQPAAAAGTGMGLSYDEVQQTLLDAKLTADGYLLPNADTAYISREYLQYFSQDDLRLAVNEIYARHGRRFNSEDLQNYFNQKTWYQGTIAPEAFDESVLNVYEKANTELIDSMRSQ